MNITILGSGFATLTAVKRIRKKLPKAEICVISPKTDFFYYPSLIWMPSGLRKASDLSISLLPYFKKYHVTHIQAEVESIEQGGRLVKTSAGTLLNDGLIIATGCDFLSDVKGMEHVHVMCKGASTVEALTEKVNALDEGSIAVGFDTNPKEPTAMRGAGPVLEFVLGLDTLLRNQNKRDKITLTFFCPQADFAHQFGGDATQKITQILKEKDIALEVGQTIEAFGTDKLIYGDEQYDVKADLILFQSGITAPSWVDNTELPRSAGGLIQADNHAQVQNWPATYVAGDVGSFPGLDWQPKLGLSAKNQAIVAVDNLVNELTGSSDRKNISFKLIYMIDTLKGGMLVKRTEKAYKLTPEIKLFHYVKRMIEWLYLRAIK